MIDVTTSLREAPSERDNLTQKQEQKSELESVDAIRGSPLFISLLRCFWLWGVYYFIDSGYTQITQMQEKKKAPLADISMRDGKVCIKVDDGTTYNNGEGAYFIIKQ